MAKALVAYFSASGVTKKLAGSEEQEFRRDEGQSLQTGDSI